MANGFHLLLTILGGQMARAGTWTMAMARAIMQIMARARVMVRKVAMAKASTWTMAMARARMQIMARAKVRKRNH